MATAFLDRVINKAIGELLIEKGTVTEEQVEEALAYSRSEGIRLGEALLQLGYVTQEALNYALGEQFGVRPMELHPSMIDERLVGRFPLELLQNHSMIPLIEMGNEIVVVVSDPNNTSGLKELASLLPGASVMPQLGDEDQIRRCLQSLSNRRRATSNFPTPLRLPTECRIEPEIPQPTQVNFANWLVTASLQEPSADVLVRQVGNECQVAYVGGASGQSLREIHRFSASAFPAVRDALWKHCVSAAHTENQVGRWSSSLRFGGRVFDLLVLSGFAGRAPTLRLRPLEYLEPSTPRAGIEGAENLSAGSCLLILYDNLDGLIDYLATLIPSLGSSHVATLVQSATRCAWDALVTLPAGYSDVAGAVAAEGATCVIFDHPVSAKEITRLLRFGTSPPAVVVCAPVVSDEHNSFGVSPDVDEIRSRFNPAVVCLNQGTASLIPASNGNGGAA